MGFMDFRLSLYKGLIAKNAMSTHPTFHRGFVLTMPLVETLLCSWPIMYSWYRSKMHVIEPH